MSQLHVDLKLTLASFRLELAFDLPAGTVSALCGPSGSGKTSLLRCLAGLEHAERAEIRCGELRWQDTNQALFVPAHERAIGYVFQEASLFPHLSVRQNLDFATRRSARRARPSVLADAIAWLGLEPLLERSPRTLSGGERQRVAIARALATRPELLLMDEPVGALDVAARAEILPNLERIVRELGVPVLYVTHSLAEVVRLADHVLWLEAGKLRASGPAEQVLPELTRRGALMAHGPNVLAVTARSQGDDGLLTVDSAWGPLLVEGAGAQPGARLTLELASDAITVFRERVSGGSALNWVHARLVEVESESAERLLLSLAPASGTPERLRVLITRRAYGALELEPQRELWLAFDVARSSQPAALS